jgi:hypothetical protein
MSADPSDHPVDSLALALARAGGIVASVANCFSERSNDFAISQSFVAHALKTIDGFIIEANAALMALNNDYDLTVLKPPVLPLVTEIENAVASLEPAGEGDFGNRIARTYDELLAKVTAAEVFAANQDSDYEDEGNLVPLLNSLKADLLRLRSVA